MLKFCYQSAAVNCILLSAFSWLDIKEKLFESFNLLDEESKVIVDWKEKERVWTPDPMNKDSHCPHHKEFLVTPSQEQLGKH